MSNNNWIVVVILIGLLRSSVVTGLATPPALSNINPSAISTTNNDVKKDSISASPSNVQPQYAPPPIAYPPPPPGQYSQQFPPSYLMQSNQNPADNSFADIKSDISSLRDTVMLLSNVVKQNAMPSSRSFVSLDGEPENNGRGRNANSYASSSYANNPPAQNNYQNNNNNKHNLNQGNNNNHNYGPGDGNTYDGPPIQIEVIQSKKGYDQPSAKVIK